MKKEYKVNNIFIEDSISLNDLICNLFKTFLDKDLNILKINDIISSDITLNL